MKRNVLLVSAAVSLSLLAGSVFAADTMMIKSDVMMGSDTMMKSDSRMMNTEMMMSVTLKMGARGNEVVKLQTALIDAGYLKIKPGIKKGFFGVATRSALKRFQAAKGLTVNGSFDAKTKSTLEVALNSKNGIMVGGALMVRNLDIVDNALNASNVTTVVAAVKAAGLVDTLKSAGPFTVFAPTNDAFAKLPA